MRICQIVEAAAGGSGRCVLNLSKELVAQGDEVVVVYSPLRADDTFVGGISFSPLIRAFPLLMRRNLGFCDFYDAWALARLLRAQGPFDVLHAHSSKAGALLRMIGWLFPRAAKIYTPHAFYSMLPRWKGRVIGWIEWILSWLGDAIIVVSGEEERHALCDLHLSKDKIVLIPNGIPAQSFVSRETVRAARGWQEEDVVLGAIGRFSPQKNPLRLIAAFAELVKTYPDLQLALIGEGSLEGVIRARLAELHLESRVQLIRGHEAQDLIEGLDVSVCASDYEGFPLVFLECLHAGVPVVTMPVGGAAEVVVPLQTGVIAQDFSTEALIAALRVYLDLPEERNAAMKQASRAQALHFTAASMAAQTRALYQKILARKMPMQKRKI